MPAKPLPFTKPVPKPSQGTREPLSQAEWATIGKELYSLQAEQQRAYQAITASRQRQSQIYADITHRLGNEVMGEVCSNCGFSNCVCE